jgi:DNA-binding MarR family transcriptional regulator
LERLSQDIEEAFTFEPLIMDALNHSLSDQHVRVLAMMFKLGGYTPLNVLTRKLAIAQPTVSNKVADLEKMGYIRKNSELKPKVLVLLLTVEDLITKCNLNRTAQQNAASFLQEASRIRNKKVIGDAIFKAINVLYPGEDLMAKMVAFTYLHNTLPRNKLIKLVCSSEKGIMKLDREVDIILTSHPNIFNTIYYKYQKSGTFIQPRLPLDSFAKNRLLVLESIYDHQNVLLERLSQLIGIEYDAIIPHQPLPSIPEIEQRVSTCLKYYRTIKIIDNSIYQNKYSNEGILKLLASSNHFTSNHKLKILTNHSIHDSSSILSSQIEQRSITKAINRDYISRDFIIFEDHGCLIIPSNVSNPPYYHIAPQFTKTVSDIFNTHWRNENAI